MYDIQALGFILLSWAYWKTDGQKDVLYYINWWAPCWLLSLQNQQPFALVKGIKIKRKSPACLMICVTLEIWRTFSELPAVTSWCLLDPLAQHWQRLLLLSQALGQHLLHPNFMLDGEENTHLTFHKCKI